ncbi:DUF1499 domain-containing protein [Ruegeria arenilitoris]|uniref:DUF1499 domain-containing protein n=1 Tax=Ruegeria arenilitoris TaxID=1173585 RepID=A0A238JWK7_9RHOB|nr:DUF1499 domain-containing protein [Ruegeria arenilitoris]SMX35049.1 hypothetical protein RUA8715_00767 [Ruegeria arenilitoris]
MKRMVLWLVVAAVVGLGLYVRLAPSDPARWHVPVVAEADRDLPGGVIRMVQTGPDGLARLDKMARATPRTTVLAGSVDEGLITYVTRSRVFGFPDYTTAQQDGDTLRIHGRLRFGRRDFDVNRTRVDGWLAALQS